MKKNLITSLKNLLSAFGGNPAEVKDNAVEIVDKIADNVEESGIGKEPEMVELVIGNSDNTGATFTPILPDVNSNEFKNFWNKALNGAIAKISFGNIILPGQTGPTLYGATYIVNVLKFSNMQRTKSINVLVPHLIWDTSSVGTVKYIVKGFSMVNFEIAHYDYNDSIKITCNVYPYQP